MNNKIIELLRHFNHTPDSFEFMLKQLEKRTFDPTIESLFSNAKDGRLYYEIEDKYKECIDQGWSMFQENFKSFVRNFGVTYKNFTENKILINKNEIKLKKALVQYLIENEVNLNEYNQIISRELIFTNKIFDIEKDSELYRLYNGASAVLFCSFGLMGKRMLYIMIEEDGGKTPSTQHMGDLSFYDGDINRIDICDIHFNQNKNRSFETLCIAYDESAEKFSMFINASNKRKKEFYKLSLNRYLTQEEEGEFFSQRSICHFQEDNGNIKMWFIKNNKLCFSILNIDKFDISFSKTVETNITIDDEEVDQNFRFIIIKNKEEYTFQYNNRLGEQVNIKSNDGTNFELEDKRKTYFRKGYEGVYSYSSRVISFSKIGPSSSIKIMYTEAVIKESENGRREKIERDVMKSMEEIGVVSLPKDKKIKLVLSINFCDWLLCSTGEKWTSCLNFESHFHAAHYQGLFGLLGDPNRIMVYFTDEAKKEYEGIESERMFTRSWCLLDKDDYLNIVKFYPLNIISTDNIRRITNLNFKDIEDGFVSKNPIRLIEYKYKFEEGFNYSSYVYQDKTHFHYKDKDHVYLVYSGEKGHYILIRNLETGRIYIEKAFSFQYDSGTKMLKESGNLLTNFSLPLKFKAGRCHICNNHAELPFTLAYNKKKYFTHGGEIVCTDCVRTHFVKCAICNKIVSKSRNDFIQFNGSWLCPSCNERATDKRDERIIDPEGQVLMMREENMENVMQRVAEVQNPLLLKYKNFAQDPAQRPEPVRFYVNLEDPAAQGPDGAFDIEDPVEMVPVDQHHLVEDDDMYDEDMLDHLEDDE